MLVLSRKCCEKIMFPSLGVTVEVVRIARNKVQLGITAPSHVPIHRQEVAQRILHEDSHHGQPNRPR
jgi:carbon storage regulator